MVSLEINRGIVGGYIIPQAVVVQVVTEDRVSREVVARMEWWLHVVNPWLLIACAILLVTSAFCNSLTALILLGIGLMLLVLKVYRIWLL
uniref:Uncharacterized protein n=1 Tax=Ignisphaera aggregans TaxID=334771 RepID=A0A7J3YTR7_9CREN